MKKNVSLYCPRTKTKRAGRVLSRFFVVLYFDELFIVKFWHFNLFLNCQKRPVLFFSKIFRRFFKLNFPFSFSFSF